MKTSSDYIPWRERAFISQRETASIFHRSLEWVRDAIDDGIFNAVQLRRGGPRVVCVQSVIEHFDSVRPEHGHLITPSPTRPALRLVWSNP